MPGFDDGARRRRRLAELPEGCLRYWAERVRAVYVEDVQRLRCLLAEGKEPTKGVLASIGNACKVSQMVQAELRRRETER